MVAGRKWWQVLQRNGPPVLLALSTAHLCWLVCAATPSNVEDETGRLRNTDFPHTYIGRIHLDLTSPNQFVTLSWNGPQAFGKPAGPFRSSPGAGWGTNNCDDIVESNCPNSRCTPKGLRKVEGLQDSMKIDPELRHVTVIDKRRAVCFHAHPSVPNHPASQGCVRLEPYAAQLIHDNSIVGKTEILIDGTWTNPAQDIDHP